MKKGKKSNKTLTIAVLVALLCIGVGYAIFSQAYNLNGTATVVGHNWALDTKDVVSKYNGDLIDEGENGYATIANAEDGTINVEYNVRMQAVGDVYTAEFDVENAGAIDVVLKDVTSTGLKAQYKDFLSYEVFTTNEDGEDVALESGVELAKNKTMHVKVVVKYLESTAETITNYPVDGQNIEASLKTTLQFEQKAAE